MSDKLSTSENPIDLTFDSGHEKCAAWLYRPSEPQRPPIVVMAHGLGGTRGMRLQAFAERFVQAGYACLVFDYRHFGDSEGEPRQLLDIGRQLADWNAAVAYARSLPNVDTERLVLWGTSFSGGHVLVTAAADPKIAAVISQCPFTDGIASTLAIDTKTSTKLTLLAMRDRVGAWVGAKPVMVPVAGQPGDTALMTAPDAYDGYFGLVPEAANIPNEVAARFALDIVRYFPGRKVRKIQSPVLFCVCESDSVAPAKKTLLYANQAPHKEIKCYSYGHFDIYTGAPFEHVVEDQLAFLRRTVPPG